MHTSVVLLLVAVGLAYIASVAGHGFMYEPVSRNYRAYTQGGFGYNGLADQLWGGGKKAVEASAKGKGWPNGRPGSMCGDYPGSRRWMKPGRSVAKYKAGGVIRTGSVIWNWHEGRVDFWVCRPRTQTLNRRTCVPLKRADGVSRFFYPPLNKGYTTSVSVPEYVDKTFTWTRVKSTGTSYDQYRGTPVYQVRYRLPRGFRCKGCIIVWHYLTGNTCAPPCDRADPKKCKHGIPVCGTRGAYYPEEFWNCADVDIV